MPDIVFGQQFASFDVNATLTQDQHARLRAATDSADVGTPNECRT